MRDSWKQSLSSSNSSGGAVGSMPTISFTWSMAVLGIPGGRERVQCVQQQGGWGPGGRVLARGVGCGSSSPLSQLWHERVSSVLGLTGLGFEV
eukprot:CAMPEP_0181360552 /NCGR_PEP_ID=MMETSP1106-20121128/6739_1 /TAXON_ID=81844 /ORGANISM="Mantoniella antarctica, Strain SL-175" /LENGTH=92 /DNA_ID=CAMNT_0023473857 /DNA_START=786 /DNA_END=1064 /DNA_ORIENTATION=+